MADITVTAARVAMCDPIKAKKHTHIAAEALTAGQVVYTVAASGRVGIADANASGKQQARGIALEAAGAGYPVTVLEEGDLFGFGVSGLDADALVYLSDTAGALADAAGTMSVPIGRVVRLTDTPTETKVLRVDIDALTTRS